MTTFSVERAVNTVITQEALTNDRDYTYFHASEWEGCHRKLAYRYYESQGWIKAIEADSSINPRTQRIFHNGTFVHDRWKVYLEKTGMLRGYWLCILKDGRRKIYGRDQKLGIFKQDIPDEYVYCTYVECSFKDLENTLWGGSIDSIIDTTRWDNPKPILTDDEEAIRQTHLVIDYKSMNSHLYEKLTQPKPEHVTQMQIYFHLTGLRAGKFIYENKNDQSVKEYLVVRDDNFIAVKVEEAKRLRYIIENKNSKGMRVLPPRPYKAKGNKECSVCKYRANCWG
jgi:hypothetical protein